MTLLVGLSGCSGAGKDTVCTMLRHKLESSGITCTQLAMAAKVKELARATYWIYGLQPAWYYDDHRDQRSVKLPRINKTPIELWCHTGDRARDAYENIWVDHAMEYYYGAECDVMFITDIRFPNEAYSAQQQAHGVLCSVVNPRVTPLETVADHAMDGWLGNYDFTLLNDGTQLDLEEKIKPLARLIRDRISK